MEQDLGDFLDLTFTDHVGLIATGRISGMTGRNGRDIDTTDWWEWPRQRDELITWVEEHSEEDLYFSPMLYGQRARRKENVTHTPVVWADTDTADPAGFVVPPTMYVETSPARYHCYWLLTEEVSPIWAEQMSKKVTYSRKEDGSDSGWALSKYLRLPGALNTKPGLGEAHRVTFKVDGQAYTPDEMIKAFGETDVAAKLGMMDVPFPDVLPDPVGVMDKLPVNQDVQRLLTEAPRTRDYSEALYRLECDLFRLGCTAPEVFVLAWNAPCNKYKRDDRPQIELWRDVLKAEYAVHHSPDGPPQRKKYNGELDKKRSLVDKTVGNIGPIPRPEFITADERLSLQLTIIDRYRDWASTKTNADVRYHEHGIMALLSTVLAEYGHAMPKFGRLNLALWFMILGQTTRTYKTTAKNLMLQLLNRVNDPDNGYDYELGSDATTEGLIEVLSERPGRAGLFHRDEAQQMLSDTKGGKSYMSGFAETLTELYDGRVRGRIRASSASKRTIAVDTQLVLYLMGVPGRVSQILTPEDFGSGFLARFLYVIGEPVPKSEESLRLDQASTEFTGKVSDDKQLADLAREVLLARKFWSKQTTAGTTVPVMVEADAWERFNKGIVKMTEVATTSDMPDLMEPTVDRMNKSVLKLACLLAMIDKRTTANTHDILTALSMSEGWYVSLHQMARMVGRSAFSAQVQSLLDFVVRKGGRVLYQTARKEFHSITQREWGEMYNAAKDQGLIHEYTDPEQGKWIEETVA